LSTRSYRKRSSSQRGLQRIALAVSSTFHAATTNPLAERYARFRHSATAGAVTGIVNSLKVDENSRCADAIFVLQRIAVSRIMYKILHVLYA